MTCSHCDCAFHELQKSNSPFADASFPCMVADAVKEVHFSAGDVLFAQGETSSALFSLTRGLVKISCHTPEGREQIVGFASPGKLLLGLQSLNDEYCQYSAVAETDIVACKILHRPLLHAIKNRGEVALRVIEALNAQLGHSRQLMRVLGHKCAASKIASLIVLMIPRTARGSHRFTLPFSRAEMASLLGLSEETVCRQMAKLKRAGVLYAPRGKIEILDWDKLETIAEEACIEAA
jgi:CRP/FNR family transcriptional regulator